MDKLRMLLSRFTVPVALVALVLSMGGTWHTSASAAPLTVATAPPPRASPPRASPPRASPPQQAPVTRPSAVATPSASPAPAPSRPRPAKKPPTGKINLNTATEDQLLMLPTVGPAKADRIVTWRRKNGGFKRVADLRRVKGFGYKTYKRLEPLLATQGDTTLAYP